MNVFDASALLAFLQGEDGSDRVEAALVDGGICGAANWSETAQKIRSHGRDWDLARALLFSYGLQIEQVSVADAERAAEIWKAGTEMSLGDRLCLALGERKDADVLTADQHWGARGMIRQIR